VAQQDIAAGYRQRRAARLSVQAQAAQAQQLAANGGVVALAPLQIPAATPTPAWLKWGGLIALAGTAAIVWSSRKGKR